MTATPERIGPYPIEREVGRGGMGVVYLGRDTRLDRRVAIKVLPDAVAGDPERLARFEREARLLASLNHPNIAGIYGIEEADGRRFLALEYVEGDTLAERLARGALPLDEALGVCRQIAAALEAAHESGVIHRDLKPGNVKLTPAGEVKVLDFGLAKGGAASASSSDPNLSASPTMTYAATSAGVILGTAAYMSPEQARGKSVDKRTDIWSFACVLYECLTARQAFEGETVSDLIARILEREPDLGALPAQTPNRVRELLRRCFEKDARRRLRDIGDARIEIEDVLAVRSSSSARMTPAAQGSRRKSLFQQVAIAAAGALIAAAVILLPRVFHRAPEMHTTRFSVSAPGNLKLVSDAVDAAISPDGRMLAFAAADSDTARLWVRPLESLLARPLPGTENAYQPFWSPDGGAIAFFADGKLKKVPVGGGSVEVLCDANNGRGGSWSPSNVILFCPAGEGPLYRVSANGGDPQAVTKLDSTRHETGHRFPCFLPDGRHFLFTALPAQQGKFDIYAGSIDSPKRERIFSANSGVQYGEPGYLVYLRNQFLAAQRFDARRLRLIGDPISLGDVPEATQFTGGPVASASTNGVLAHVSGQITNARLVWVDRAGKDLEKVTIPPDRYTGLSLSPDGKRAALVRAAAPGESDIWLVELERGLVTRFTYGPAVNETPIWSPDGSKIAFRSNRNGPYDLYVKPVSGATPEEPILQSSTMFKQPDAWSMDGRFLLFRQLDATTGWDIWVIPMEGDHKPQPYLRTRFNETGNDISPDGRWITYTSDESGRDEAYVQSFPTPGNKYQVTTGGGNAVGWPLDGKRLFYGTKDGLMVVDVQPGAEFHVGAPRVSVSRIEEAVDLTSNHEFKRLLALKPAGGRAPSTTTVMLDWTGALRKP